MGQEPDAPAPLLRIGRIQEVRSALTGAGVATEQPVLVLVGGAGGMSEDGQEAVGEALRDAVMPVVERQRAVVLDGGTDSGVMRLIGRERAAAGARFPLIGVAAAGTVIVPGEPALMPDAASLEPHHTLFVLVPGTQWGAEGPWIGDIATIIAGSQPSVTILINGGQIAYSDASGSLDRGRPLIVLAGTGRTADAIAAAHVGAKSEPQAVAIAASPLTRVAHLTAPLTLRNTLEAALTGNLTQSR